MMRSLSSGVSGLRNHQTRLDVVGNNIANVNTMGFKASRVTFQEAFSQTMRSAQSPHVGSAGGRNPSQIGNGMQIGSVDSLFTQGSFESTGVPTDLAIEGDSFFVVSNGERDFYTRAGDFTLDGSGRLVSSSNGMIVQGRMAEEGVLTDRIQDIGIEPGMTSPAKATTGVELGGNLDANAEVGDEVQTSITIFDSRGEPHQIEITFEKTGVDSWGYTAGFAEGSVVSGGTGTLAFDSEGRLDAPVPTDPLVLDAGNGSEQIEIDLGFGEAGALDGLSHFASPSTAAALEQDGFAMGELADFAIDDSGTITGAFTNGETQVLGRIAVADFTNPAGLDRQGSNLFAASANSGEAVMGFAGESSTSTLRSGVLELSNVDLSREFTQMITTQRGFQSNARVITTTDEMLQEVVSLRR